MVSTRLKDIANWKPSSIFGEKTKNSWNHHLVNLTVHNSLHHALLRGFQLCLVVAKLEGTQLHVWGNILSEFGFLNWGANTKELRQEVHGYMCCILFERLAATWEKNIGFSWIFKALVQWHQPNFPYTDTVLVIYKCHIVPHGVSSTFTHGSTSQFRLNFWLVLFQWNMKIRCCLVDMPISPWFMRFLPWSVILPSWSQSMPPA